MSAPKTTPFIFRYFVTLFAMVATGAIIAGWLAALIYPAMVLDARYGFPAGVAWTLGYMVAWGAVPLAINMGRGE